MTGKQQLHVTVSLDRDAKNILDEWVAILRKRGMAAGPSDAVRELDRIAVECMGGGRK